MSSSKLPSVETIPTDCSEAVATIFINRTKIILRIKKKVRIKVPILLNAKASFTLIKHHHLSVLKKHEDGLVDFKPE